jgi:flagellar biosynthetic protein FliQ
LIQAVTQINETSLSFLPKIAAVLAALLITAGTAQRLLTVFSHHIFAAMITIGGS